MNAAHIHLMVNHTPLFAALFGGALLMFGLWRRHSALLNVGLVLAIVAGLGAVAAVQTGEAAEEIVEGLSGVAEATIESHEEAAEAAMASAIALAALALVALAVPSRLARAKRAAATGSLALAVLTFGLVARTANLGGEIRHPEIANGASVLESDEADEEREIQD
jgi:uncharacterized membrane protein